MGFLLLPHNELYYVIITNLNESESMLNPVIHGIFPTPLIFTNIEREFTKEELEFFDEQSKTTYKNEGNITSLDNYLMRHDPMTTIKQEITSALQMYLDNIIKPKDDVKPYITQSWLNYTAENQHHHKHAHPNSFVSAVFYIKTNPEVDRIFFYKDGQIVDQTHGAVTKKKLTDIIDSLLTPTESVDSSVNNTDTDF